jgi:hypothetical protein
MCVVSMVSDHYAEKWRRLPWSEPFPVIDWPHSPQAPLAVTREEFDALKRDVEGMKALLKRAKEYDERNGEPDCEVDEKMDLIRRVAAAVGVDLDDVIGAAKK